jgi:TolB-like protein/Tfp pilus assembly protein PilF
MRRIGTRLGTFVAELKRRHVLRFAIVYLVVGFAVIEATDLVAPTLDLSEHTYDVVVILTLIGFPIALVLTWMFDLTRSGVIRTAPTTSSERPVDLLQSEDGVVKPGLVETPVGTAIDTPADPSIAVLPFVNLGDTQEDEYLSDGLSEELIHRLANLPKLRVAARTSSFSFKGLNQDISEIGNRLNVATVVEGSVRRRGDRLRVTAQLIDVSNGFHLWSDIYDRQVKDVFAIQDEIARAIADRLRVELLGDNLTRIRCCTASVEAYGHYLKGRYLWNRRRSEDLRQSIEFYERAIESDDRFPLAYAGMADSYSLLGWYRQMTSERAFERASWAARKAIEMDGSLAEAHSSLGYTLFLHDWDWESAEREFKRAIDLNPNYSNALHWYAEFLMAMERFDEAEDALDRAQAIDPLSLTVETGKGWLSYFMGRYEEAIERYEGILAVKPNFVIMPWFLGPAYVEAGRYRKAIELYDEWLPRLEDQPGLKALRARALAMAGQDEEALDELNRLETQPAADQIPPEARALVAVALGKEDRALTLLEEAVEQRSWPLVFLNVDPSYGRLRTDPRFGGLLERIGLRT